MFVYRQNFVVKGTNSKEPEVLLKARVKMREQSPRLVESYTKYGCEVTVVLQSKMHIMACDMLYQIL